MALCVAKNFRDGRSVDRFDVWPLSKGSIVLHLIIPCNDKAWINSLSIMTIFPIYTAKRLSSYISTLIYDRVCCSLASRQCSFSRLKEAYMTVCIPLIRYHSVNWLTKNMLCRGDVAQFQFYRLGGVNHWMTVTTTKIITLLTEDTTSMKITLLPDDVSIHLM